MATFKINLGIYAYTVRLHTLNISKDSFLLLAKSALDPENLDVNREANFDQNNLLPKFQVIFKKFLVAYPKCLLHNLKGECARALTT